MPSADLRRWVRSARSAPALHLTDVASLLGGRASGDRLRSTLGALESRGPCAALAAKATRRENTAWAALEHRSCPPGVHRGVEATVSAHIYTRRPGVGAWRSLQHADAPATEATLLRQLASTNDQDLVEEVAANPNCPPILLERLVGGAPWERVAVAANPAFGHLRSAALLAALPSDAETSVKIAAAACPACPPEMLAVYAADDDWEVRDAAASSPACPAWLLDVLADDPNHTVALSALTR